MANLKPFNLQEALAGKKVVTRDGREVIGIKFWNNATNDKYSVAGCIDGVVQLWTKDGGYFGYRSDTSRLDLFMAPETKKVYIGVYLSTKNTAMCSTVEEVKETHETDSYWTLLEVIEREYEV